MSVRTLKAYAMSAEVSATPVHNGSSDPYPPHLEGFLIQADGGDVYLGGEDVATVGLKVRDGETINIVGFLSRGTPYSYDLTQLYYVGGPWRLIVEVST